MVDVLTPEQRRLNMSRIQGKNTKPDKLLRSAIHARGLRYRLHVKDLPGRPDMVFSKYRVALFIHGCFWHGHNCSLFRIPETRREFWENKINGNRTRDLNAANLLQKAGWRVLTVWECALRGRYRLAVNTLLDNLCQSITSGEGTTIEFREMSQIEVI